MTVCVDQTQVSASGQEVLLERSPEPDLEQGAADTHQAQRQRLASLNPCCRCISCLVGSILLLVGGALLLIFFSVCCMPCWCRALIQRIRRGPSVVLDGTRPPELDDATRENIEQAQASTFRARLDDFVPQVVQIGRNLRTMSTRSLSFSPSSERPGTSAENERVEQLREQLKAARRRSCVEKSQRLPPGLRINVSREHVLEQSLQCIGNVPYAKLLADKLSVTFQDEQGVDAGGLSKDWFDSLGRNLFTAAEQGNGHLMLLPDKTLAPQPHDARFTDLYAIGRISGLAVWFGIPLSLPFSGVVCKFCLDAPIMPSDVQRLDPEFYQYRVYPLLRDDGVTTLFDPILDEPLKFMSAATENREPKPLCPGGAKREVTEENKHEYIKLLCEHHLCGDMQEQIKVFLQGFWDVCPKEDLMSCGVTHRELALLISGYSILDLGDWRSHTKTSPDHGIDEFIGWFWEIVGDMSDEDRAKLLHFATGSSRLPSSGFPGLSPTFNISVKDADVNHLPQAHTCSNQLVLPLYTSRDELKKKMRIALENDEGFGFL